MRRANLGVPCEVGFDIPFFIIIFIDVSFWLQTWSHETEGKFVALTALVPGYRGGRCPFSATSNTPVPLHLSSIIIHRVNVNTDWWYTALHWSSFFFFSTIMFVFICCLFPFLLFLFLGMVSFRIMEHWILNECACSPMNSVCCSSCYYT